MRYMNLEYSHNAELLHSSLIVMVTRFPLHQVYPLMYVFMKNIFAKYEREILSCCGGIAQFLCCRGNSVSIATR